jgi:nucleotide-binding universal stress UspA family protein
MIVTPARTVRDGTIPDSEAILNYSADAGIDLLVIGGTGTPVSGKFCSEA